RSEEMLSCLTSNVRYKLPHRVVRQMLCDTVAEVYSPEEVYRRYLWNAENVFASQIQGLPPIRNRDEQKHLVMFAIGTLLRVVRDAGLAGNHRKLFWRYLWRLIKLRRAGKIHSVLDVLLRTVPTAHHLIAWARELLHDHAELVPTLVPDLQSASTLEPRS